MKAIFTVLFLIFFLTDLQAQEIEANLSGNTSDEGFSVKDNFGTNLFRITGGGNIGIGTTSPTQKLDVVSGNIQVSSSSATETGLYLGNNENTNSRIWQLASGGSSGQGGAGAFAINQFTQGLQFEEARLVISTNGNVGIGTTSPAQKLVVNGDGLFKGDDYGTSLYINGITTGLGEPGLRLHYAVSTNSTYIDNFVGDNTSGLHFRMKTVGSGPIDRMFIRSDGNVGIGTTSPNYTLDVNSSNDNIFAASVSNSSPSGHGLEVRVGSSGIEGALDVYRESGVNLFKVRADGNVIGIHGTYHAPSDRRLKKEIITIPNALTKVMGLRGVNFKWKDSRSDQSLHMGFIAQEVEKVVPEVVNTADDEMHTKAVEYQYLVGLLVEAVKEQQKQIENLEKKINSMASKETDGESFGYLKPDMKKAENLHSIRR